MADGALIMPFIVNWNICGPKLLVDPFKFVNVILFSAMFAVQVGALFTPLPNKTAQLAPGIFT